MTTIATKSESLFYFIQNSPDNFTLDFAVLQIPRVAKEGTAEYRELIQASAAKRMELEQSGFLCRN